MKMYRIRRAILNALFDYVNPQNLSTILNHTQVYNLHLSTMQIATEWQNLIDFGYLVPSPVYPDYCKIAPEILEKMNSNLKMHNDVILYGPDSVR